jgi:hypothetical protein
VAALGVELVTVPFAHAGHWFAGLAYAAPVIVLVGWMLWAKVKDRRSGGDGVRDDSREREAPLHPSEMSADDRPDAVPD